MTTIEKSIRTHSIIKKKMLHQITGDVMAHKGLSVVQCPAENTYESRQLLILLPVCWILKNRYS